MPFEDGECFMNIGVLALQGDFAEHSICLRKLGVRVTEVRLPSLTKSTVIVALPKALVFGVKVKMPLLLMDGSTENKSLLVVETVIAVIGSDSFGPPLKVEKKFALV